MNDPGKAVFLSYASQDADAAKRICEALRAAGVEVWFDQNELVGGDAWDTKIRKQIKECALLIPIISASTNARAEGYFRLEWRLADQRTHLMGRNKAFLLPVTIDGTTDAYADVPDSFIAVQWTKAPGGEVPAGFVAQVKRLLDGGPSSRAAGSRPPTSASQELSPPAQNLKPSWRAYAGLAVGALVIALGATWFLLRPKYSPEDAAKWVTAAQAMANASKSAAPQSPSAAVIDRVQATLAKLDVTHAELDLASDLMARAAQTDPTNARVFATWASVDFRYINDNYDASDTRRDALARHMAQAMGLDSADPEVRLARAITMVSGNNDKIIQDQSRQMLEVLQRELPQDWRVYNSLGWRTGDRAAAEAWWDRQAALPGQAATVAFNRAFRLIYSHELRAGYPALVAALKLEKSTKGLLWKAYLEIVWLGDLAAAQKTMAEVPAAEFVEDMAGSARSFVAFSARDFHGALAAAQAIPRDFLASGASAMPTGYMRGVALQRLGRTAAAQSEWRAALVVTERRLATEPNDWTLLMSKAVLVALLGDKAAGAELWRTARELHGSNPSNWLEEYVAVAILPPEEFIARLESLVRGHQGWFTAAVLRLNPYYDAIRNHPRFVALQAEADADPKLSPTATIGGQKAEDGGQGSASDLRSSTANLAPDNKSVAVLAFANLSDDKANEYFSDGISEELLNVLAKVPGLKVTARTSSFFFKGKEVPIPEIAKQLGVAFVIEGSVRKAGDKVRITAQLIKAADGFHVWSDTFTRDLKDVFAVQDEIAGLIAQQLQLKLGGSSRANKLVNPEAYDLYLRARALSRLEDENFAPMIKLYEAAVAKDPEFVLAHVQLSLARASDYWSGGLDSKPAARAALQAAQRLAPDAPETRLAAGSYAYSCENDWNLARTEFLAAEAGLPGDAQVAFFLGMVQRRLLSFDESIRQVARAIELDPADRNNFAQQVHTFKALRRYPELVDLAGAALKRFPADEYFLQTQAIALCEINHDQAAYLRRVRELPSVEARARALKDYSLALNAGEWEAAGRILAGAQLDYLSITPATTRDPIAMQQAMLAHLQGRPELAQQFGAEALAYYQTEHWSLRQDKWMKVSQALALAYAGRGAEAMRLARETLAATALRDPWDTVILHTYAAQVYLAAGHRDEAFAELRIMMTGPCLLGPEELRRDPLWRTVKDDPRFEEILRSARQL